MKQLYRAILTAVLLCGFVRGAQAQGQTQPQGQGAPQGTPGEPWSLSLGVNGSYEGNALFVGPEQGQEFANQVQANVGRTWTLRRGSATLNAGASQSFYQESTALNDFRYNVGGGLSHALTRRLSWTGGSSVTDGLARDSEVLTDAGLVLPSINARTSSSSSTFSYLLTPRSDMGWSLTQTGVGFSSAAFTGGSTLGSVLSWRHQVGRSQTLGVSQEYQRTFSGDTSSSILGLLGTWSAAAGLGWTASASAGIRPFTIPGESGYQMSTGISAGLTKPVRLGQTFGINYSKSVEPTFGTDRTNHLVQTVSGNYDLALRPNLSASFGGTYSRGTTPVNPDVTIIAQVAQTSLAYRVTPHLGVSVGYSIYRRTDPPAPQVTSYRTFLSLTYSTTWR